MKTFCIHYRTNFGTAEYYTQAESKATARTIFRNDFLRGDIDYETDGTVVDIVEQ